MAKATPELVVITKIYDLVIWGCQHVARFPRSHKFTVGDRLAARLQDLFDLLVRAKFQRDRRPLLEKANLELELLRLQLRMAKDLKCLPVESYGFAARSVDEVGRMVGGWIKTAAVAN
jgi:hypothetical protein